MRHRRLKPGYFALEALNSLATTFYFYYIYFLMSKEFGFSNRENLLLSASNGFLYIFAAWFGGRFGQRFGYFTALSVGFAIMGASLAVGALGLSLIGQISVMLVCTLGMCFTWPNLEALVSENESPHDLSRMVGIYNLVWAGMNSLAFFTGGALLETLGLRSLFVIPVAFNLIQLGLLFWLKRRFSPSNVHSHVDDSRIQPSPPANQHRATRAKLFLKLSWFANPFAYVAINTIVAVIPGLARRLELSPMWVGFFCSIWMFSRLGTFLVLWLWTGWHYRFRWIIAAFALLIGGFTATLLVTNLWLLAFAQIAFGFGLGLIYYSSLFYSMDLGDAKGEHGGLHEAAIGIGLFAGPAVGASALYLFPEKPESSTIAVAAVLVLGFVALLVVCYRARHPRLTGA